MSASDSGGPESVDGATVEVIRNYLVSAAKEMHRTLVRTAYSVAIYEVEDFGISIYDRDLNLVADSPGLTTFLGSNDYGIEKGVEYVGEENLEPGDVLIMNYPYWSSAHALDVCLFAPVFVEGDGTEELVGYAVVRAHWLDLGAKDAGYVHDSTDMHQEGVVFPGTKLYKTGEADEEIFELLKFNSRMPDKTIGDLHAQIAAIETGKRRLTELYETYGSDTVDAAIDRILDHGQRKARRGVRELPDGSWSAVDYVDDDGITDELIRIEVEVTIDGDEFTIDLSESADEVEGPMNVPIGMTESMCKLALKSLTTPDNPSNAGQFAPLSVIAPEGNIFRATYPAPTFTLWTGMVAIESLYKALAEGMPERVPASSGGDICSMMLVGHDPDTGRWYVEGGNEGVGWGGTADHDGPSALMHITESTVRNSPVEVAESKAPVRIRELRLREDSGGPGRHRGGLGVVHTYQFTHPGEALATVKKTKTEGWGLDGGEPGPTNTVVWYPNSDDEEQTGTERKELDAGDAVGYRSGGGGGYGDPHERPPKTVREDVVDGYVSRDQAREAYGVVVTDEEIIDWDATRDLRSE